MLPHSRLERRKRERLPLHLPLRLEKISAPGSFTSFTENISSGGFCCIVSDRLTVGDRLRLRMHLLKSRLVGFPAGVEVSCTAHVVRVQQAYPEGTYIIGCEIDAFRLAKDVLF